MSRVGAGFTRSQWSEMLSRYQFHRNASAAQESMYNFSPNGSLIALNRSLKWRSVLHFFGSHSELLLQTKPVDNQGGNRLFP